MPEKHQVLYHSSQVPQKRPGSAPSPDSGLRGAPQTRTHAFHGFHGSNHSEEFANPVDYQHPYESMGRFAQALPLRYDSNRTRHAYYRQVRLIHEHLGVDPALLTERSESQDLPLNSRHSPPGCPFASLEVPLLARFSPPLRPLSPAGENISAINAPPKLPGEGKPWEKTDLVPVRPELAQEVLFDQPIDRTHAANERQAIVSATKNWTSKTKIRNALAQSVTGWILRVLQRS